MAILGELAVLAAFVGMSTTAHALHKYAEKRKEKGHAGKVNFLAKHTPRFIILVSTACAHPATLNAMHEYAVHFIVYSGYVLHAH